MILAGILHPILATLFALTAIFLMMVILLQRGKGVGLAGAFGGQGGQTAFGSKTGDVLTWATVVIASFFLLFSVGLNYLFVPQSANIGTAATISAPVGGAPGSGATGGAAPVQIDMPATDDESTPAAGDVDETDTSDAGSDAPGDGGAGDSPSP